MNDIRKYISLIENVENNSKIKPLHEGVRFGGKEKATIDAKIHEFGMGVEYEFHASDEDLFNSIGQDKDNIDYHEVITYNTYSDIKPINNEEDFDNHIAEDDIVRINIDGIEGYITNDEYFIDISGLDSYDSDDFSKTLLTELISLDVDTVTDDLSAMIYEFKMYQKNREKAYEDEDEDQLQLPKEVIGQTSIYHIKGAIDDLETFFDDHAEELYDEADDYFKYMMIEDKREAYVDFYDFITELQEDYDLDELYDALKEEVENGDFETLESLNKAIDDLLEVINPNDIELPDLAKVFYDREYVDYNVLILGDSNIYTLLDEYNVTYTKVEPDGGMIEVITGIMPVNAALVNMTNMFKLISEHGTTDSSSGMHISISKNNEFLDDINFEKMMILLSFNFIQGIFPNRNFVDNFNELVEHQIQERKRSGYLSIVKNAPNMKTVYDEVSQLIDIPKMAANKYQSVNTQDYHKSDGRIELRYFGGEDYHNRIDDIEQELYRALYIIDISYSDLFDKEFNKAKYVYLDKINQNITGITIPDMKKALSTIDQDGNYPKSVEAKLNHIAESFGYGNALNMVDYLSLE